VGKGRKTTITAAATPQGCSTVQASFAAFPRLSANAGASSKDGGSLKQTEHDDHSNELCEQPSLYEDLFKSSYRSLHETPRVR
jgi:hypothetical protein